MKIRNLVAIVASLSVALTLHIPSSWSVPADLAIVTHVAVRPSTNAPYLNGSLTVSWDASADALQYTVMASRIGTSDTPFVTVGKESTQAVVDGLVGGATYIIQVRVIGDGHVSPWTANTLTSVPITLPKAPAQPSVTAKVGSATINWVDLVGTENGGSPVTEYKITETFSDTTIRVADTDASATMLGLTEGATASFTVSAITAATAVGVASVTSTPITILAAQAKAPDGGQSHDISGGGGGGGGGGGPSTSPTPTASSTPTSTAMPSQSAIPTYAPTAKPSSTPSPSVMLTPPPSPSPSPTVTNSFFEISKVTGKPSTTSRVISNTKSLALSKGKTLQLVIPAVPKGSTFKAIIKTPDGKSVSVLTFKTKKNGDVTIPTLNFKKPGTYVVTVTFGKIKKVITINVSNPVVKKVVSKVVVTKSPVVKPATTTLTVTCTDGKATRTVTSKAPQCPSGFHRK